MLFHYYCSTEIIRIIKTTIFGNLKVTKVLSMDCFHPSNTAILISQSEVWYIYQMFAK